jgi:hypothetical protein
MTWRVSWQQYRQWGSELPTRERPPLLTRDFNTQDEARAECERLKAEGFTACVASTPPPKPKRKGRHA